MRSIVLGIAGRIRVPVRQCDSVVRYCGGFYGQTDDGEPCPEILSVEGLLRILRELPHGVTELGCHPGHDGDLDSAYRDERAQEVPILCDPRVRDALPALGVELCSFARGPQCQPGGAALYKK